MAVLPTTGITTSIVGPAIGSGSRDVGTLCTHSGINKWSRYKPVRLPQTSIAMGSHPFLGALINVRTDSLLLGVKDDNWVYQLPRGVNADFNEPYRLGDFRGYRTDAAYSHAPFGIGDITVAGSSTVIAFNLGGGSGSEYITTPYNMSGMQSYYPAIQIYGGASTSYLTHLYSYCSTLTVAGVSAPSTTFMVPTSVFSTHKIIMIIPFIAMTSFPNSATNAGSGGKYLINGFAPQRTYKYYLPAGQPEYLYTHGTYNFNQVSSSLIQIDFDLYGQWTQEVRLYATYLNIEFWSGQNATGSKIYEVVQDENTRLPDINVPPIDGSIHIGPISAAFGGPFASIKVTMRDYYRNKTYSSVIYNKI